MFSCKKKTDKTINWKKQLSRYVSEDLHTAWALSPIHMKAESVGLIRVRKRFPLASEVHLRRGLCLRAGPFDLRG